MKVNGKKTNKYSKNNVFKQKLIPCHFNGDIYFVNPNYITEIRVINNDKGKNKDKLYQIIINDLPRYISMELYLDMIKDINKKYLKIYKSIMENK